MTSERHPILLTGGSGFIGSTLVRQWLAEEPEPLVDLDAFTYAGLRESLAEVASDPRHVLVEGNVADARLVRELLAEHRPAAIVHVAAETHVDRSIEAPPKFVETNVLGTCTLLDQSLAYWRELPREARQAFRFVLVSTDEVFGAAEPGRAFREGDPPRPNSPYAASKAATEHLARAFSHTYGLPVITINPTNNYGPRQMPEKLIPRMIAAALRGERLPIYGDGLQERDWLHVDDCCRAIRMVLRRGEPGRAYLAGTGRTRTNLEVVSTVCEFVDGRLSDGRRRQELIQHITDRPGHDRRYAVDSTPLREELGWATQVNFDAGLRATVDWYLDNPAWLAAAEASLARRTN